MASLSALDEAIELGTIAVEAEKSGRLQEAQEKYGRAVGLFLEAIKGEPVRS